MANLIKLIFLSLLFSSTILAADGSSGCGPGWYLFKKNSLVSSSLRATTNGMLFPAVTLGMTFGTSNCSKHGLVKTEKKTIHFVTHNYHELKSDAAKGQGDFLYSYAKTIGCKKGDIDYFSSKLQDRYEKVFKDEASNEEVIIETYRLILNDKRLVYSCSLS